MITAFMNTIKSPRTITKQKAETSFVESKNSLRGIIQLVLIGEQSAIAIPEDALRYSYPLLPWAFAGFETSIYKC
ncbi:hypothetical protein midi_00377 [Candidatus Midichloria mitochondrii IricVA]|uniref:Uncharacterized protein n=1 Tax=Midichloria mitochondrii (strain IricVA) TaxID=696127 RepID=F7XVI8_MIDMI|nr:hypothetical protein midi_00377 [Candidatus Midichloria mitochondrii IricVA]